MGGEDVRDKCDMLYSCCQKFVTCAVGCWKWPEKAWHNLWMTAFHIFIKYDIKVLQHLIFRTDRMSNFSGSGNYSHNNLLITNKISGFMRNIPSAPIPNFILISAMLKSQHVIVCIKTFLIFSANIISQNISHI